MTLAYQGAQPPAPGRHRRGHLGERGHPRRAVAVPLDLGDALSPQTNSGDRRNSVGAYPDVARYPPGPHLSVKPTLNGRIAIPIPSLWMVIGWRMGCRTTYATSDQSRQIRKKSPSIWDMSTLGTSISW